MRSCGSEPSTEMYTDIEVHEAVDKEAQIFLFLEPIDATIYQFSMRFAQFRKFEDTNI